MTGVGYRREVGHRASRGPGPHSAFVAKGPGLYALDKKPPAMGTESYLASFFTLFKKPGLWAGRYPRDASRHECRLCVRKPQPS